MDLFGNTVVLEQGSWAHVLFGHPDMKGKETLVRTTVEAPTMVSEGDLGKNRFVFDRYNLLPNKIVRAVLQYDANDIGSGTTSGTIVTAYTPLSAGTGKLGKVRYFSGKKGAGR